MVKQLSPFAKKPMYLPFAWLQLVLDGSSMSTYLLTANSLNFWNKCHECIFDFIEEAIESKGMLNLYHSKIVHQEEHYLSLSIYNEKINLVFEMHYDQNDWYIDLIPFMSYLSEECMVCLDQ